ncbi:hypothetical protein ABTL09_19560 [Acinetobacter baumannii]
MGSFEELDTSGGPQDAVHSVVCSESTGAKLRCYVDSEHRFQGLTAD